MFCGNTDLYLRSTLLKERDDDVIHTVIMKRKITGILTGIGFQEQAVVSDCGGIKCSSGWQGRGL